MLIRYMFICYMFSFSFLLRSRVVIFGLYFVIASFGYFYYKKSPPNYFFIKYNEILEGL